MMWSVVQIVTKTSSSKINGASVAKFLFDENAPKYLDSIYASVVIGDQDIHPQNLTLAYAFLAKNSRESIKGLAGFLYVWL